MSTEFKGRDWSKVRKFATEFFEKNPGASINQCTKAMNNARLPPGFEIAKEVKHAIEMRRLTAMQTHPGKPETATGPKLITPPIEEDQPEAPKEEHTAMPIPPKPLPSEKEALTDAARHIQAAMRLHNLATCIFTVDDTGPKTKVTWEVTRKSVESDTVEI